jgi:ADP-heptose:LPS heptosyltransferase
MASRAPARGLIIARALRRGAGLGRSRPRESPRRILVAHHLLLGDTLLLTPLLAKLRERYPEAEIVMSTPAAFVPLYQHRPYGVTAVPYDLRDRDSVRALLRQPAFDLAVVPGDNWHSWLARAAGARWIVAFAGDRPAYKNWPVDEPVPYPDRPGAWGDLVAGLVPGPAPAPYRPAQWPAPDCRPFDPPPSPYAVLHIGARNPLRLWSAERWRALAAHLAGRGLTVAWSGGPGEERYVEEVGPGMPHSYAGRLDLAQLWRLLRNARLLVCADTGVAHLGRVTGVPTVTLFGPGSAVLFGAGDFWRDSPYRAVTIEDFPCRDQHSLFKRDIPWMRHCSRPPTECAANRCMQAIAPEQVLSAIEELSVY